jgi:group I intron endonuclease
MNKLGNDPTDTINETEQKSAKNACCGIYGLQNKLKPDKWYVGQSLNINARLNKAYRHGHCQKQPKIYNALKKYGYDGFEKVILEICLRTQLEEREIFWIKDKNSVELGYNVLWGGRACSEETIQKLRNSLKGKFVGKDRWWAYGRQRSEETKRRIGLANKGKKHTQSSKQKLRIAHTGKHLSEEHRKNLRLSQLGKKHSLERIENIRNSLTGKTGRITSDKTKQKIRDKLKGRVMSEEHKAKLRKPHKVKRIHTIMSNVGQVVNNP